MSLDVGRARRQRLQQLLLEVRWRHYRRDPAAFFRDCIQVPAGKKLGGETGRARLDLFDYQLEALDVIDSNDAVVILKARQLGLTTVAMAYALHHLLFFPGANVVLVSKNQDAANSALELMDFMWHFLPPWMKTYGPELVSDAARTHKWRFYDGMESTITSYAATKTVAAGQTATLVVWDEAALAEHQEDVLRTLTPTTDAGGKMLVFSTARGGHNTFAQLYRGAERGENKFTPLFFPWHVSRLFNPKAAFGQVDRSLYDAELRSMSDKPWLFFAERPSSVDEAFRQSGRSRFTGLGPLEEYEPFGWRGRMEWDGAGGIALVPDPDGPLRLAEHALEGVPYGHRAAVALDPATGVGGDYTAMTVGWVDEMGVPVRAGFWHCNETEPAAAAVHADLLGRFFTDETGRSALLAVEKQGGYGDTFINELQTRLEYDNLYVHVYTGHRQRRRETTFGFPMTWARRPLVIDLLAKHLAGAGVPQLEGVDPLLRAELGQFVVREDGRVTADVGCHDDLVMSTAIWLYVAQEASVAMVGPKGEDDPATGMVSASVAHIFDEAERVREAEQRLARRQQRRFEASWRRRR